MTASQGRANCAISLAWLAFGGMTLYQGRATMTSVLHPVLSWRRKAMRHTGLFCCRAMSSPTADPTTSDDPRSQSTQRAEVVMLWMSSQEAEKREWEQENIYRTFLLLFCLDLCQAHLAEERGNVVSTRWNFEWIQAVSKETCSIIVKEITSWIICGLGREINDIL